MHGPTSLCQRAIHKSVLKTHMVATTGETLALTAGGVSDKLDRFLAERYGDVLMMAGSVSEQPHNREFQSAYIVRMKALYPGYLWLAVTNARRPNPLDVE